MTTEKTEQKNEQEEKCATTGCCSPQHFAEMMTKCGEGTGCGGMMQKMMPEMMKSGCCQPEQK